MAKTLRLVVLDILKPHEPGILEVSSEVVKLAGIDGLNTVVYDVDKDVERVKITIEGKDIPIKNVIKVLEGMGTSLHGIDEVSYGNSVVRETKTLRDKYPST